MFINYPISLHTCHVNTLHVNLVSPFERINKAPSSQHASCIIGLMLDIIINLMCLIIIMTLKCANSLSRESLLDLLFLLIQIID